MDAGAWVYPLVSTATDPLSQTTAGVVGVLTRNLPTGKLFPRSPPSPLRHDRTVSWITAVIHEIRIDLSDDALPSSSIVSLVMHNRDCLPLPHVCLLAHSKPSAISVA
jgi:hypothetical protein